MLPAAAAKNQDPAETGRIIDQNFTAINSVNSTPR
jgi:hypothetical protein